MMPIAVVIDWYGPFSRDRPPIGVVGRKEKVIYMALRDYNVCCYIGRTQQEPWERLRAHEKLEVNGRLWVGRVSTSGKSGRRQTKVPTDLRLAEHALIFALQPERNEALRYDAPDDCVVVYSRCFDPKTKDPVIAKPKWPTLVVYDPSFEDFKSSLLLEGPLDRH